MLYQWQCNPTNEMRTIGIITETLGNVIEMLKQLPTIIIRICYYISQLNIFLQVWADF